MSSLTITIIQPNLHWENKKANLDMLAKKIESIKEKTEVVILPEMFSTGFSMQPKLLAEKMDGKTIEWMKKISSSKKIILTGSVIIEEDGKYFNRLIWMLPNGEYGVYDKRHLFAYADEHNHYSAGNKRLIAQVKGWKINLQVCYDLRFPVWSRQSPPLQKERGLGGEAEYDLLVNVANWPERRIAAWKTLLQARAIENQCYVVGVNRVGDDGNNIHYNGGSTITDPLGEILYHKANDEDVFTYTLQKEKLDEVREKFPFWRDADSFDILP
ncbi:MAG TPA: amidohydrolase [Chitinophagaceae bacterium]